MYPISAAYKAAMQAAEQHYRLRGTIGGKNFTEDNVIEGSFSIANQCAGNDEIKIGQVYIGELKSTFRGLDIPRYSWQGLEIKASSGLRLAEGSYEDVPLGVYDVAEAEWSAAGITVTAYDHMARFDRIYSGKQTYGTAYELTQLACSQCGVELGMTEEQMQALPNGTETLSAYAENDIETWRDFVSWLAQTLCANATMDRDGKLIYRTYGGEPVDTIDDYHRFTGASFSDFVTRYTGISVVNASDQTTSYYGAETDDGLTYNLGNNPFLQYGTKEMYERRRKAVLTALQGINYMPFKASAYGTPAYDLGDTLVFAGGLADGQQQSCLTKFTYHYNGKYEMQGVGKNPALASAKSKADKELSGLMSQMSSKAVAVYGFVSAEAHALSENDWVTVVAVEFATVSDEAKAQTWTDLTLTLEVNEAEEGSPAVCEVTYYLDGQEQAYHPKETWSEQGAHHLSLNYLIGDVEAQTRHRWSVALRLTGGHGSVAAGDVHAVISGQGLASGEGWNDKRIEIEEAMPVIALRRGSLATTGRYRADAAFRQQVPVPMQHEERYALPIRRGVLKVSYADRLDVDISGSRMAEEEEMEEI